jgi:Ca2+-binding EF-hand superfamily protein
MKLLAIAISIACIGLTSAAVAAEHGERGQHRAAALDTDGNGTVSFAEFTAREADNFARIDSNADSLISVEELASSRRGPPRGNRNAAQRDGDSQRPEPTAEQIAERQAMMQECLYARFTQMDSDDDGALTLSEFQEFNFLAVDSDNDGKLTREELRAMGGNRGGRGGNHKGQRQHTDPDA